MFSSSTQTTLRTARVLSTAIVASVVALQPICAASLSDLSNESVLCAKADTTFSAHIDAHTGATQTVLTQHPSPAAEVSQDDMEAYTKFRVGGYGELLASFLNYGQNRFYGGTQNTDTRRTIAIPRMTLAADYRFNHQWNLGLEVEFEAGGVGIEQELEKTENLEYETEMEKGGEVALEQFHITFTACPAFSVRVGHQIVPLGLINAHHEPIFFFGTSRPEGETTIIPSTWHETGLSFLGQWGRRHARFAYEVQVVAGLNPDGFGRDNWVADGKQGLFEADNFTSPAYVARLDWIGIEGLRLAASVYHVHDVTKNADKTYKYSSCGRSPLTIWALDGQYANRFLRARANFIRGSLDNAAKISAVTLSNGSNYHHGAERPVAKVAMTYGFEVGADLKGIFYSARRGPALFPFVRYDYFNPQEEADTGASVDERCQVSKWTGGINWFALPNLAVKADFASRRIGTNKPFGSSDYHHENEFSIGVAYVGWFFRK